MIATESRTLHLSRLVPNLRNRRMRTLLENPAQLYGVLLSAAFADEVTHHHGSAPTPGSRGLLYRLEDATRSQGQYLLVQSRVSPRWNLAPRGLLDEILAAHHLPEYKSFDPVVEPGQILRFRLRANPTQSVPSEKTGSHPRPRGKVRPVLGETAQRQWLINRLAGIAEIEDMRVTDEGNRRVTPSAGGGTRLISVLYEGYLRVQEPEALADAITTGIGRGKAFGFGLLSIARV
jgi:CRISPR system Cascade subunit CasE